MRCKDCFLKHCRDHMSNDPEDGCDVCGGKTELLAEGIDLVTSKKGSRTIQTKPVKADA